MRRIVTLLVVPFLAAACDPPVPAAPSTNVAPAVDGGSAPALSATALAAMSSPDLQAPAQSSNAFAFDLYAQARAGGGNLAFSPLSLWTALTMTWAGARGETAAQMARVLHLERSVDHVLDPAGRLLAGYQAPGQPVTLRVANRLFGEKAFAFDPDYLARTRAAFGAPLEAIDFRTAPEAARQHINAWVAEQTADRIKDLVAPGGVNADTRLVLTNAIYFLGDWLAPFTREATRPAPFHLTAAQSKDVPTMHQTARFRFAATDGVKVLELPYQGGDLAMTLVLPDAIDGLGAVEARLAPAAFAGWLAALDATEVLVSLPRLEINPPGALSVGPMLGALGMPLAFDQARADFTGIANPVAAADRLHLDEVFHKAFVKVDEKGTEAAAATAVVMMRPLIARRPGTPPAEFTADHPFLFVLRDLRSGMILFLGRVSDPAGVAR